MRKKRQPDAATGTIHRYFEVNEGRQVVKVLPGGVHVSGADEDLVTVLGSCVAACMHDPEARVGGMNHFMLPEDGSPPGPPGSSSNAWQINHGHRYGCFAMEFLINGILKAGGRKERLRVKIFGGANALGVSNQIGAMNVNFARHFLKSEGLPLVAEDVGGRQGRKVKFNPRTGQAFLWLPPASQVSALWETERHYQLTLRTAPAVGEMELF